MNSGGMAVLWVVYVAVAVFLIVAMWKVFVKAGQPGWACIVPLYNAYKMLKIAGKPGWWLVLLFIPLVDIVVAILTYIEIARKFGQSDAFAVGLIFLPFIFFPILGFGRATYTA
jgi:uncharacterized membrane protein